jgi:hypothetical protein
MSCSPIQDILEGANGYGALYHQRSWWHDTIAPKGRWSGYSFLASWILQFFYVRSYSFMYKYQDTWRHVPVDCYLHTHRRESLKPHKCLCQVMVSISPSFSVYSVLLSVHAYYVTSSSHSAGNDDTQCCPLPSPSVTSTAKRSKTEKLSNFVPVRPLS